MHTGIAYSSYYEGIRAAIASNATLDELKKWIDGLYPPWFMGTVVAAYRADIAINNHAEDVKSTAIEKRVRKQSQGRRRR